MQITNFRRASGDSNRVGVFDAEIIPGLTIKDMRLTRKDNGEFNVFGRGVYIQRHAACEIIKLVLQLPASEAQQHEQR